MPLLTITLSTIPFSRSPSLPVLSMTILQGAGPGLKGPGIRSAQGLRVVRARAPTITRK